MTSEPLVATSIKRDVVTPVIGLPPTSSEGDAQPARASLPADNTVASIHIGTVAPAALPGEVTPGSAPAAPAAVAAARSLVQPVTRGAAPTAVLESGKRGESTVRTASLDDTAIAAGWPIALPEAHPAPSAGTSKDLTTVGTLPAAAFANSSTPAAVRVPASMRAPATGIAPATATGPTTATGPATATGPTVTTAVFAAPVPLSPTTSAARREQLPGQSRIAPWESSDPPAYTIVAPPPPNPSFTGDAHLPTPLRVDPAPTPADFAIETPSLGAVGAEVTRREHLAGDALHVHFAVDRSGTAALIAGVGDGLAQAVAATGNRLEAVTIEVRGETTAAMSSGADPAGSAEHRGDAPQHRPPAPPPSPQATSTRVRSPAIKPVARDRFA